ncbi:hypothetical protein GX563_08510, partial [Candidatus Bathyarchaeota archaeon]|nr:hypothetical protein [Candidatus Bathyarchaeota archaeon]
MRSLIVTTGTEKYIMNTWLPSLRDLERGNYQGDILIVDYEASDNYAAHQSSIERGIYNLESFKPETVQSLKEQPNIIYHRVKNKYTIIPSDRINAFNTALNTLNLWEQYDVLLFTDGNDIHFLKPIQPLLEASKNRLTVAAEHTPINDGGRVFAPILACYPSETAKFLFNKPSINAGVIASSPAIIKRVFAEILHDLDAYTSDFGSEQIALSLYCYRNGFRDIGAEYNCHPLVAPEGKFVFFYEALFGD